MTGAAARIPLGSISSGAMNPAGRIGPYHWYETFEFARRSPGRYDATTRQRVPPASEGESRLDSADEAISAGRRNADLALAVVRSYGVTEANETYAVRLMSSLIHGYITLGRMALGRGH